MITSTSCYMIKPDDSTMFHFINYFQVECSLHINRVFIVLLFVGSLTKSLVPFQLVICKVCYLPVANKLRLYLLHETDFLGLEGLVHQSCLCNGQSKRHPSSCNSHPFAGIGHKSFLSWKVEEICTKLKLTYTAKLRYKKFFKSQSPVRKQHSEAVDSGIRQKRFTADQFWGRGFVNLPCKMTGRMYRELSE